MSTTMIRSTSGTGLLAGTWPLRPFHPDGFVGTLEADGQQVRVAALACDEERLVALSLVGFDTSIGVVLARLWTSTAVPFTPAAVWQQEWNGPELLKRSGEHYKQCVAHLEGTREVHALALLRTAHLTEGILHPPDLPEMGDEPAAAIPGTDRDRAIPPDERASVPRSGAKRVSRRRSAGIPSSPTLPGLRPSIRYITPVIATSTTAERWRKQLWHTPLRPGRQQQLANTS